MPPAVGERAPAFRLRGIDNETWILGEPDTRRSVLVVFFGRESSAARVLLPFIERIHRRTAALAAEIIGISLDSQRDSLEFAADYSFTFPILVDAPEFAATRSWGVTRQPAIFRLDAGLRVADSFVGWDRAAFGNIATRHLEAIGAARRSVWEPNDIPPDSRAADPVFSPLRPDPSLRGTP